MTQQDDITQRVLTDEQIMRSAISACDSLNITRFHEIGAPSKTIMDDAGLLELGRAIESALLSKLRAAVADEPVPYPKREDVTPEMRAGFERLFREFSRHRSNTLARNEQGAYKDFQVAADWTFYQRAWADALASAPVADNWRQYALPGETTAEQVCERMNAEVTRRTVAAMRASAPVAVEPHDGLRTLLAELPGMHEDPKKGDAVFRCGVNGALNVVERRIRELLRSAPVAGEAHEPVAVVGADFALYWAGSGPIAPIVKRHGLKVGSRLYAAPQASAEHMQTALQKSFDMGKFYGSLPETDAEDVRNAALEEAAASIDEIDDGAAPEYRACQEHIRALKTQADKDGGQQRNWVSDWSAAIKSLPMGRADAEGIRSEEHTLCDGRAFNITPDLNMDFRAMPFAEGSFSLVVFDPPHLRRAGRDSWLRAKYGILGDDWQDDLRRGLAECFRVLKPAGVLIFKWAEVQIPVSQILALTEHRPLFGHKSGKREKTHWLTFMKPADTDKKEM